MKKALKIFLVFLLVLFALVAFLLFSLNNTTMLNKMTSLAISQSGFDVKYESIEGGLFDGLALKGFNYEEKVKADLKVKADILKLKEGVLHIKDINLSNLWIDEEFLASLSGDKNESVPSKSDKESFIKKIIVDNLNLGLVDFHYDKYVIDSLNVSAQNLSYDMKKDISGTIKADLKSNVAKAILKAKIKDEKYTASLEADPKKEFLAPFLTEHNVTISNAPYLLLDAVGDFQKVNVSLLLRDGDLNYQDIKISPKDLNITALFDIDKGDLDAKILGDIDSSVANLNLQSKAELNINDINNTLDFDLNSSINTKIKYFKKFEDEQNITISKVPNLNLQASGNLKKIDTHVQLSHADFRYNDIVIKPKGVDLNTIYSVKEGDLNAKILSNIDSNVANFDLNGKVFLNSKDINNTLKVDFLSHLLPHESFVKAKLDELNISVEKFPNLILSVNGDYKNLDLLAHINDGEINYNSYKIESKLLDLNATYSLKKGDLKASLTADINSNIAFIDLNSTISLNSKDINNTLVYKSQTDILAKKADLKEFNVTISKPTKISLDISGDAKNAKAVFDVDGEIFYDGIKIKPNIYNTHADFDLRSKFLKAEVFADVASSVGSLKSATKLSLNIDDLNNTLMYDTDLFIKDTKPYKGVDLSSLGDIKAYAKGSLKKLDAKVESPKLTAIAKSNDFDTFVVNLDTRKIYIGKIYRYLPKELQESFVAVKSDGFYKLSSKEAKFKSKLGGLKYAKNIIFTDEFDLHLKGEDIRISNLVLRADGFKMNIDVDKVGDTIKTEIKNKALNAKADIKFDPLYVDANAKIGSIKELIKEINKVYPLEAGIEIDGSLDLLAVMEGEDAKITLNSPKIKFQDGTLVDLNILSYYNKNRILMKTFGFELKGFKPKEFNRVVRLKKDALITFDETNSTVDLELENLLAFKGAQIGDTTTGTLSTKNLVLAYKGYGYTKLTTDLEMFQTPEKLAVTGFIEFKDSEITYESPFLDVSKDPDIVIITRESKGKKEKPNDDFLQNTFLDLDIRSKNEMIYNVDAGEIEFSPDINIRKDLGSEPKITGKIKVLDGQYDMADKRFQIEEGAIAFRGQEGSNPLLDLHVNYEEIEDVIIQIAIGGDKNRPKLVFSSKPMMSKKDIFSYLLFGMSASETEGAATSANKAAEKIFGRAIAKDLARELNLDRLDMNRNSLGGIDVKAGKKINRKSIIYYQNKLNESSVLYERKLSDKWSVETEVGKQGQGADLYYKKGYK